MTVLSQPVLDDILARRGKHLEEKETVFSRVHIDGQSKKSYTIKLQAMHAWNFDKLREVGIFTKEHVEYGVVNVEKVPWNTDDRYKFSELGFLLNFLYQSNRLST